MSIVAAYQTFCDENNQPQDEQISRVLDVINQKQIISTDSTYSIVTNKADKTIINDQAFAAIMASVKRYRLFCKLAKIIITLSKYFI